MKKIVCFMLVFLMICCLCSCFEQENANEAITRFRSSSDVHIWTDDETGVQYIIYDGYRRGGICPRLSADGSLYIDHPTEKGGVRDAN